MTEIYLRLEIPILILMTRGRYTLPLLRERLGAEEGRPLPTAEAGVLHLASALHRATQLRKQRLPTVATTLAQEYTYNENFLELHHAASLLQDAWRSFVLADEQAEAAATATAAAVAGSQDAAATHSPRGADASTASRPLGRLQADRCLLELGALAESMKMSEDDTWWRFSSALEQMVKDCAPKASDSSSNLRLIYGGADDSDDDDGNDKDEAPSRGGASRKGQRSVGGEDQDNDDEEEQEEEVMAWRDRQERLLAAFVALGGLASPAALIAVEDLRRGLTVLGDAPLTEDEMEDMIAEGLADDVGGEEIDFVALARAMGGEMPAIFRTPPAAPALLPETADRSSAEPHTPVAAGARRP
eukprot:COSAG01_NODE_7940_length_2983_cov_2.227809_3_plen_359_part_00